MDAPFSDPEAVAAAIQRVAKFLKRCPVPEAETAEAKTEDSGCGSAEAGDTPATSKSGGWSAPSTLEDALRLLIVALQAPYWRLQARAGVRTVL